jgi:hypothetical protein
MGSIVVCLKIFISSKVDRFSCLTFNRRVKKNVFRKGPTNVNHCVKMMILFQFVACALIMKVMKHLHNHIFANIKQYKVKLTRKLPR